jgi:hypothetical protein
MSDNVTRELLAMGVRIGAVAAILGAFYATVGVGDTTQLLCIAAAAAFGSQAAAFGVRRIAGDKRGKLWLVALFLAIAIAATIVVVVRLRVA